MTIHPSTGPELFLEVGLELDSAFNDTEAGIVEKRLAVASAQVSATQAQTAAIVMLTEVIANAKGVGHYDLEAWREVIPQVPLKECRSKFNRRPECTERHTEDCTYADPVRDPKHGLLPVGTRVLVSDRRMQHEHYRPQPYVGKVDGHDMHHSKYRIRPEIGPGTYSSGIKWAFADNRVQVHPDGPECPPAPQPVKREPTGPRVYVQDQRGKQGYLTDVYHHEKDNSLWYTVQFFTPGAEPVKKRADSLTVIAASQVERCPNGQTGDECGSSENQCEPCRQTEDEEGDMIEESMGLR